MRMEMGALFGAPQYPLEDNKCRRLLAARAFPNRKGFLKPHPPIASGLDNFLQETRGTPFCLPTSHKNLNHGLLTLSIMDLGM